MIPSPGYFLARIVAARKRQRFPDKPNPMDGDHGAMWDFMFYMNGRIDKIIWFVLTGLIGIVATLVAVLVK